MINRLIASLALILISASLVRADVRVAQIFQDHMVLQRDMKVPVWGWADPGAAVKVTFAGQEKAATADAKGKWRVDLDPMPASDKGQTLVVTAGGKTIERKDVLVGDVWVLNGQSNMARPLRNDSIDYPFFKDYSNDAEYPTVRFTDFGAGATSTPLEDVEPMLRKETPWKVLNKATSIEVMSIGFFFAKQIIKGVKVPIGLVQVAVSGTPQTAWMPRETIETFPGEGGKTYYETAIADAETKMARNAKAKFKTFAEYEAQLDAWRKDPKATERNWPAYGDGVITDYPSVLYNTRVSPLIPMAFRGMLWHQGEAGPGGDYGGRMVAAVKRQRELFGHDFTFIFGTLTRKTNTPPPLVPTTILGKNINLSMVEGDQLFGEKGNATLVNFVDIGNPSTHWAMKEEAGRRMARAAMDKVYGQKTVYTGPQLISHQIKGNQVTCKFRFVGTGLQYKPSIDGISGVVAVDKTGKANWAEVKVTAPDTLIATIPGDVASLQYACSENPHETLFNGEGYTAFPFAVGAGRTVKPAADAPQLVKLEGDKGMLHVAHVRREGYIVQAVAARGAPGEKVTLKAYIPDEWKGIEILHGKDPLDAVPKIEVEAGRKYVRLEAQINGEKLTIAEPGKAAELAKVNRF